MILEIYTKNLTRIREVKIETTIIPRVGETISLTQDEADLQGVTECLVFEVTHVLLKENRMTPIVKCYSRNGSTARLELLLEQGWLTNN